MRRVVATEFMLEPFFLGLFFGVTPGGTQELLQAMLGEPCGAGDGTWSSYTQNLGSNSYEIQPQYSIV